MAEGNTFQARIVCESDEEGNLVLEFPDELLEMAGWEVGDELSIEAIANRIVLRKVEASV